MAQYVYEGSVRNFNDCICTRWRAMTEAPTEAKAKSNLAYRYKKEHGLSPSARITLPGKLMKN